MPVLGALQSAPTSSVSSYIPAGWGSTWRAARDQAKAGTGLAEIVWFGDSTTFGDCPGSPRTPITQLMRELAISAGFPDGGRGGTSGGIGDVASASGRDSVALVQSVTGFNFADAYNIYIGAGVPCSHTTGDSIVYQGKGTQARLHYTRFDNGGRFSYRVNGGAWNIVDPVLPPGGATWVPEVIAITGLPGGGAINTIEVHNDGGPKLAPLTNAPSVQAPTGSIGPAAGTYFYKVTVIGVGGAESAPTAASTGATVNGSQSASLSVNTTSPGHTLSNGRTFALYRATSSAGTYGYMFTFTAAVSPAITVTDDGTVTPNAARNPPTVTADAADNSVRNDVKAVAEFFNTAGLVWHNVGIQGAMASSMFDTADPKFNLAAQGQLGLFPASTTNADERARGAGVSSAYRRPPLVLINYGINDIGSATSDTDAMRYQAQLSLATRMAQNAGADVLLIAPVFNYVNGVIPPPRIRHGLYRAAVWNVAQSHGAAVIDMAGALGTPAILPGGAYGAGPADPHPKITGYQLESAAIWNLLAAV